MSSMSSTANIEKTIQSTDVTELAPMMSGENIVCFAKDWNGDPTSVTHVMRQLALSNRVLWLNSIATRTPDLSNSADLSKIVEKLKGFLKGPQKVSDSMWVYTPIVLPLPHNPIAIRINKWILRTAIGILRRKLKMQDFQLWAWPPTAGEYVDVLGQSFTVYYCADAWSSFSHVDGRQMERLDTHLCRRADVVFATGHALAEERRLLNPETHLATHGVPYKQFAAALEPNLPAPTDLADCPQPIIGFYGLIEDWMDQDLVTYLAERHPEWTIALVGKICVDVSRLEKHTNIRLLGRKPHSDLPAYCKQFAVGVLPHRINDLTRHMNPIKLREYLCAGLPIVSTALPEVQMYGDLCSIATSYAEFENAISDAIGTDNLESRRARSEQMKGESWEHKVNQLMTTVMRVRTQKRASHNIKST